jgi:hypothetical protein
LLSKQIFNLKVSVLKKKGVDNMQFVDSFAGPIPEFEVSESKKKSSKKKKSLDNTDTGKSNGTSSSKKKKEKDKPQEKGNKIKILL